MFNNGFPKGYNQNFGQQSMYDQIDNQINQLQQMREQIKNNSYQPAINQTFQLAPTNNHGMKYANTIDEVNKETVFIDTPYFSNDLSVLWIKSPKGNIKTYELNEIVPKDEKDIQIEYFMAQVEELKGKINNESNVNVNESVTNTNESEKSSNVSTIPKFNKKPKKS